MTSVVTQLHKCAKMSKGEKREGRRFNAPVCVLTSGRGIVTGKVRRYYSSELIGRNDSSGDLSGNFSCDRQEAIWSIADQVALRVHSSLEKLNIESMFHIYAVLQYIPRVETMGILGRFWRVPRKQLLKEPGTRCKRPLGEP